MSYQDKPSARIDATTIWQAGVAAVDGRELVRNFVRVSENSLIFGNLRIPLDSFRRLLVVGAGKASGWMAAGLEQSLGPETVQQKSVTGRVNVPDDQVAITQAIEVIGCRPAGINLPTERVIESTAQILQLVRNCDRDDLCVCLISGGASALLEQPVSPISLEELRSVSSLLSNAGAPIEELNAVRRQISQVKAGRLAQAANCKRLITLVISDVLGDPLEMIGSGPTVASSRQPRSSSPQTAAIEVLRRRTKEGLSQVPRSVIERLNSVPAATPEINADTETIHFVIGNNLTAVTAAQAKAQELGYQCTAESCIFDETAEQAAARMVNRLAEFAIADSRRKQCLISGGEPTVSLSSHPGKGGRNQHLVLTAIEILLSNPEQSIGKFQFPEGSLPADFSLLSGGTDGEDGNVSVAGGVFDAALIQHLAIASA